MSVLGDPRLATATATSSLGTGLATMLEVIPNDIGKLASLVGIVLSIVLIWYWIQKVITDGKEEARRAELHEMNKKKAL